MPTSTIVAERELVRAYGSDGHEYIVRPTQWDVDRLKATWDKYSRFNILSDDVPKTVQGFSQFVINGGALWFDIVDLTYGAEIGLMYLGDLVPSYVTGKFISATWHAIAWDSKAGPRRPVARAAIKELFRQLGFHRIQTEIPACYGGAIRTVLKIGFVEEGRYRQARRLEGVWYDVRVFSLLEDEVALWVD